MKKRFFATILTAVLLFNTSLAFASGTSTNSPYTFSPAISVTGSNWFQSGYIKIQNTSNELIRDWTFEFETNKKIQNLENVIYKEIKLNDGSFKYIVKPASWMTWEQNKPWTHKYAIAPSQSISIKIYGNDKINITDLQLKNGILYDSFKSPLKIEIWKVGQTYAKGDLVNYNGKVYKCIQAHTVHASNWTPILVPALWSIHK